MNINGRTKKLWCHNHTLNCSFCSYCFTQTQTIGSHIQPWTQKSCCANLLTRKHFWTENRLFFFSAKWFLGGKQTNNLLFRDFALTMLSYRTSQTCAVLLWHWSLFSLKSNLLVTLTACLENAISSALLWSCDLIEKWWCINAWCVKTAIYSQRKKLQKVVKRLTCLFTPNRKDQKIVHLQEWLVNVLYSQKRD